MLSSRASGSWCPASLRTPTVAHEDGHPELVPVEPTPFEEAVRLALEGWRLGRPPRLEETADCVVVFDDGRRVVRRQQALQPRLVHGAPVDRLGALATSGGRTRRPDRTAVPGASG